MTQLKETLRQKLIEFGLSYNQAKIYVSIACSGCSTVREISETTRIHSQDVYKTLLALKNKGLVVKTINKPMRVEAIPIETGLNLLLDRKKDKFQVIWRHLEETIADAKQIFEQTKQEKMSLTNGTRSANVLVLEDLNSEIARNKVHETMSNMKIQYDLVIPVHEISPSKVDREYQNYLRNAACRGIEIRILIIIHNVKDKALNKKYIEIQKQKTPLNSNCHLREIKLEEELCFCIIDSKEVWIPLNSVVEQQQSRLVTDSKALVAIAKREFESLWNDPRAQVIPLSSQMKSYLSSSE
ncbi:MAG: hypothetical protein NWF06_08135 [Candidatus Bathyarchaeota archaeon]|nr:hypothetical protein [Candidatus Bathyarchaeum sp.]